MIKFSDEILSRARDVEIWNKKLAARRLRFRTPRLLLRQERVTIQSPRFAWMAAVNQVVKRRQELLVNDPVNSNPVINQIEGGRLLYFYPRESTSDGFASLKTNGLIDTDEVPPWDWWIDFEESQIFEIRIVSWVSSLYVRTVEEGLSVQSAEPLHWAF